MIRVLFGIVVAVTLHAGFLLFGGLVIPKAVPPPKDVQQVELFGDLDSEAKKPDETVQEKPPELEAPPEDAPDPSEIIRALEAPPVDTTPALEAVSLSAIEAALNGQGGASGDFAQMLSFTSGGRIGGTGKGGPLEESADKAFSLAEIDQKPRAIFQAPVAFPSEMRGKKVDGLVTVIFVVDANGRVASPRVEKASHPAFEKPALEAVRKWKFEPAVRGGQRVACKMRVPIRFPPS